MKGESMLQFNIDELTSLGKEDTKVQSSHRSNTKAEKLSPNTTITHYGKDIGTLCTIEAGQRCDCPNGHLHSDKLGNDYAHTVRLTGGEIGIRCSGDSCNGLFIPYTLLNQSIGSNFPDAKLDVKFLDTLLLHFTEDIIPEPIRRWTLDNCLQTEGCLNYGVVSAIIVCANAVGMQCQVKPKHHSNWKVTLNLWGMVIGEPSQRKSPVVDQFLKPLKQLELEAAKRHKEKMLQFESDDLERKVAQKTKKKALEEAYEMSNESMISSAKSIYVPQLEEPKMERFIINDATTEKTGELMSVNERTILQYRDELAGFFTTLSKKGRESDRAFYLEAFKGDSPYTYDRIARGTIHIERLSIGLFGTIQPSVLANIIPKNDDSGDGLSQRMQLAVFSDGIIKPYYDAPIDIDAKEKAYEIIKKLAYENYELMSGAIIDYDGIPYFTFDDNSQTVFVQWYGDMKIKERNESDKNMQAHIGKYYGLLPSLALVFFLIDKVAGVTEVKAIGVSHLKMAIEWCDILETHARKMYALSNTTSHSKNLTQKIIEYVQGHQTMLPASFGKISQNIRGVTANDVEKALRNIAIIEDKQVMKLLAH